MGFTHYFKHSKIALEKWQKIVKDVKRLYKILPKHSHTAGDCYGDVPLKIQYEYDKARPPVANIDEIRFNGVGDMGHETFYIERIPHDYDGKRVKGRWFGFCKTARKPYDFAVQVVLLIVKHHVGQTFELSSDGDDEDWSEASRSRPRNTDTVSSPPCSRKVEIMILIGVMLTLLILGALNLLFLVAMVQGLVLFEKETGVVGVFAVQAIVFLLVGFTIMATLAATGQMPN